VSGRRAAAVLRSLLTLALLLCPLGGPASAAEAAAPTTAASERVAGLAKQFFPGADTVGDFSGEPPAAPVSRGGTLLGYVFLTDQVVSIPAYSGKPISTLVALDLQGVIRGVRILQHQEPILVVGISDHDLEGFTSQYPGRKATDRVQIGGGQRHGYVTVDGISGATITIMVLNASIMRSAKAVAASRGLPADAGAAPHRGAAAAAAEPPEPMWKEIWRGRVFQIAVLVAALFALTLMLVFQDWLAKHPSLLLYVRDGYLLFTLAFVGWYAMAQLSVVNVLTFLSAAMHEFRWEAFLMDPMMFILWTFVAVTLLLWGRGVYCGWLCPYGALQELVHQLAKRLRVPTWEFPDVVHERLWAVKYIVLILLFGLSLQSLNEAERYAEIEPFKTVFVLQFHREWGFVVYALGLVLVSAVNRKFFCKYLCPLGAALAIPARLKLFDWLKRRKECGRPCQICANECEVRAVGPTGEINANECHYCLDCQVTYWNAYKCPPMVERRKRHERAGRAREIVKGMEPSMGASGLRPESPNDSAPQREPP
jgi:NosR/NirI family nitrous oxide reductase transcriptional regulator